MCLCPCVAWNWNYKWLEPADIGAGLEPTQVLWKSILCSIRPALQALAKLFLNMMMILQHTPL